jgi:hypothetical protein
MPHPAQPTRRSLVALPALILAWACGASPAASAAAKGREAAAPARVSGPAVNLVVEVRVIDEAQAGGHRSYTVSTRALAEEAPQPLQLQVLNGQAGVIRLGRRLPVQWVQAAARGAAASAASAGGAGAVVQAVTWVDSGQGLWVQPQWPGGEQPVDVALHVDVTQLSPAPPSSNTPLPVQHARQVGTRLDVPLDVWTTFAATGTPTNAGSGFTASTVSLSERGRQLMQVRVSRP